MSRRFNSVPRENLEQVVFDWLRTVADDRPANDHEQLKEFAEVVTNLVEERPELVLAVDTARGPTAEGAGTLRRVYISGPISGLPRYMVHAAFYGASQRMKKHDKVEPVNPLDMELGATSKWEDLLKADLRLLTTCDEIALLPGWERSKGAVLEWTTAVSLGLSVVHLQGDDPWLIYAESERPPELVR